MHLDPHFQEFSIVILFLLFSGIVTKLLGLPNAIGFLLSGILIGPGGLGIVDKASAINQIGSAGVVLLLFFLGLEMSPKELVKEWKVTVLGTLVQIIVSVLFVIGIGHYLDWPLNRSILLGFVISLSSTVMVIQLLQDKKLTDTRLGKDVLGILIAQDIMVVPMLIIVGMMGDSKFEKIQFIKQIFGTILLGLIYYLLPKINFIKGKIVDKLKDDNEIQVLFCLSFAFGIALLSGALELSTALGAFVAGSVIAQLKLGHVFHHSLFSLKLILNALFFSTIGLLLDINFFLNNIGSVLLLTFVAMFTNTLINAGILIVGGRNWKNSLVASAFLSQVGEFSFILAAIGMQQGVINEFSYQLTIFIIFISILITPLWLKLITIISKPTNEALLS
ncbi:MAG: sodium:proton exchanger [Halobacteriovorax sp.]|nr:sodium:proton exchanger [Halobacteriovorax sp.]